MSAKDRNSLTAFWDFFCSLKLTIVTLILLAMTSIIGTVVQQGRAPQDYLKEYSETTYRVLSTLKFTDMYHSWWFLGLLEIFALNLIACSIKRLPRVLKTVREPVLVPAESLYRTLSNTEEVVVKGQSVAQVAETSRALLGKAFAGPVVSAEGEKVHLFAQKMPWARFGVYVTHLSILIIFAGAILGSLWGYKAYVNIVEGTSTNQVWPRGEEKPIDLGFQVRCDDFSVSFYGGENAGRPKEFKSLLSIIDGGKTVVDHRPVIVNDPLTYKGITFYQASYGHDRRAEHQAAGNGAGQRRGEGALRAAGAAAAAARRRDGAGGRLHRGVPELRSGGAPRGHPAERRGALLRGAAELTRIRRPARRGVHLQPA